MHETRCPPPDMSMTANVDKDFAAMMIYNDGIKMARQYLKRGKEQKIIQIEH